jgi:hypothetical protein
MVDVYLLTRWLRFSTAPVRRPGRVLRSSYMQSMSGNPLSAFTSLHPKLQKNPLRRTHCEHGQVREHFAFFFRHD